MTRGFVVQRRSIDITVAKLDDKMASVDEGSIARSLIVLCAYCLQLITGNMFDPEPLG